MTDLKLCPFCGADPDNLSLKVDEIGPFIYCACCDTIYTIANGTIEQVVKGWNRRVEDTEECELALVNAWLDSARFDTRLTEEEQDACWTVLEAVARI